MGFDDQDDRRRKKKDRDYRDRSWERDRERERDRDRDRGKDKDRKDRDFERDYRDRDRKEYKRRDDGWGNDQPKRNRERSPRRSPSRKDRRDKFRKSKSRSRSRRQDKYRRWEKERKRYTIRQRRDFRFDSPPKNKASDEEEDPDKMKKLNHLKAQQQLVSSKADRKLYLGNLPPNINANQLMELLNSALKKMDINTDPPGDSIVSAWISPDGVGHYAFIEFRSAQQATNGTALNNASLFGYQLKLGRPKQYLEYNKQLMSDMTSDGDLDNILRKIANLALQDGVVQPNVEQRIICPPTRVLILKHIVTLEQLAIDEEYKEIYLDVQEMAERFGTVVSITIPRPIQHIDLESAPKRVKGLGYVFIEYQNVEMAKKARKQFITKMFSDRSVACGYFDPDRYKKGELDIVEKVTITF